MADKTYKVRYFQDREETQGPYLVEFDTEDKAQAFIDSIGTGELVDETPEPVEEPVVPPLTVEGDNSPEDTTGTGESVPNTTPAV